MTFESSRSPFWLASHPPQPLAIFCRRVHSVHPSKQPWEVEVGEPHHAVDEAISHSPYRPPLWIRDMLLVREIVPQSLTRERDGSSPPLDVEWFWWVVQIREEERRFCDISAVDNVDWSTLVEHCRWLVFVSGGVFAGVVCVLVRCEAEKFWALQWWEEVRHHQNS